mgnify:CR=1 FL=1
MQQAVHWAQGGRSMGQGRAQLEEVRIEASLDDLMLKTTAVHRYRNDSAGPVELVYTFPAAWGAVLLGVSAQIGDRRLSATVLPRAKAERRYEEAIEEGDSPVMVERAGRDLYTANIGNLLPGESAQVECELLQPVVPVDGRLRLAFPTVVASRYGDGSKDGGLAAHQRADSQLFAEYPLHFRLQVRGALAEAVVHHRVQELLMGAANSSGGVGSFPAIASAPPMISAITPCSTASASGGSLHFATMPPTSISILPARSRYCAWLSWPACARPRPATESARMRAIPERRGASVAHLRP